MTKIYLIYNYRVKRQEMLLMETLTVLFTCSNFEYLNKFTNLFTYNNRKMSMSFKYGSAQHLNKVLVSKIIKYNLIYSVITKLSDHANARETMPDETN